jgi:tetratricopeptide (TPR) repeat protein
MFLKGKAELRQAADAFTVLEGLTEAKRYDGALNLARVLHREGRLDEATAALVRASEYKEPPAPEWTVAWLSGVINREQGRLEEAETNFRKVLEDRTEERTRRGFDFSKDYEVINLLGQTLFERAKQVRDPAERPQREVLLKQAAEVFQRTLKIDSEDVAAHYGLQLVYQDLGNAEKAAEHAKLHARFKPDDNARDVAIELARRKYPAAAKASEPIVIYTLNRAGAPGLQVAGSTADNPKSGDD